MESTLGRFSKTDWSWGCCFGAAWSSVGSQILHDLTSSVPGQVYAKHVPINANRLGPPRVSSPGGPFSMVVTGVVGIPQGFGVPGLGTRDLAFLGRRDGGCGPQGAGDDVSPANPCPAEATTLPDLLMLTLDTGHG